MNIVAESVRKSIQSGVSEFLCLVTKLTKTKAKISKDEAISIDTMVRPAIADWKKARQYLAVPEEQFAAITIEVDQLAKHLSPSRSNGNIEPFLVGVRSIYARYGVSEQDFLTDALIYKFSA